MRVPARDQRQVYTGYVNEQGHGDTEEAHPKPPIAVSAFPIGTMNMRFMMVTVLDLIHSCSLSLNTTIKRDVATNLVNCEQHIANYRV